MASMTSKGCPAATASPSLTAMLTIVPCIGARHGYRAFGRIRWRLRLGLLLRGLAERQHGQRIDGIDLRAGLPLPDGDGAAAAWK